MYVFLYFTCTMWNKRFSYILTKRVWDEKKSYYAFNKRLNQTDIFTDDLEMNTV